MENSPIIKVAIIRNKQEVSFVSQSPLQLQTNGKSFDVAPDVLVTIRIKGNYSLREKWILFREELQYGSDPEKELRKKGYKGLREVGRVFEFKGKIIYDNRSWWLYSDIYDSEEELLQEVVRLRKEGESPWTRKEIEPQGYQNLIVDLKEYGSIETEYIEITPMGINGILSFTDVPIGRGFHWERYDTLRFTGRFYVYPDREGGICVVNELGIEEYLKSVIRSELSVLCPEDALKAQAISARSTVFATAKRHHYQDSFDLCSTDHCQVYLGIGDLTASSIKAVEDTFAEVITYRGKVCDARFSTICGGITENYENVWSDPPAGQAGKRVPYLVSRPDCEGELSLLKSAEDVKDFIDNPPECYCSMDNPCLRKANGLFRWEVEYKKGKLEEIIYKKRGIDIGELLDIEVLKRGYSGRITQLRIVGSKRSFIAGGELNIRRILSTSHLYSSLFYPIMERKGGKLSLIRLKGGGFGHGVGMCQVGCVNMAQEGRTYREILKHYYSGIQIDRLY